MALFAEAVHQLGAPNALVHGIVGMTSQSALVPTRQSFVARQLAASMRRVLREGRVRIEASTRAMELAD